MPQPGPQPLSYAMRDPGCGGRAL